MQVLNDITEEEFDRIFAVNIRGMLFMTQAVARGMIARARGGAVVNIASGAGRRSAAGAIVYSASKAAVISLTQGAALELIPHGIRVNAIAPGAVRTPMWAQVESIYAATLGTAEGAEKAQVALTPAGRLSTPDEYAGAAIFLACPESSYMIGQTINVDGGMFMS
jgi:NAD(P)-dependent dehydrogenase (short-subunit alcohol dehydrogenase family)